MQSAISSRSDIAIIVFKASNFRSSTFGRGQFSLFSQIVASLNLVATCNYLSL
jgi:hypothetical protein